MLQDCAGPVDDAVRADSHNSAPHPPAHLRTLPQVAQWRGEHYPNEAAFTFLVDGEEEKESFSYAQLDRRARQIAGELLARGAAGQRVLLLFPPGLDFIASLFGCLYAGALAVPVNPPDPLRMAATMPRLQAVVDDARARFVLGSGEIVRFVAGELAGRHNPEMLVVEQIPEEAEAPAVPAVGDENQPALLQYTSGSTGRPRGIVLSHANLMYSFAGMHREDVEDTVGVCWLPPYHDFGLIAGILLPVYSGRHAVLMSPLSFVERPLRWLEAISRYRGTTTGSPNFGYDLCVRKMRPEECDGLDLSCWKIAVVGAEPVRAETLARFTETFRPYGFRPETFMPAYGLAEIVLNATSGHWWELPVVRSFSRRALEENRVEPCSADDPEAIRLVGCGKPWHWERLAIVDPKTRRKLESGQVGEIWIESPQVGLGYWNRREETARTFHARLVGRRNGRFLRTGDLGFVHEGQLFVTGRIKELIILDGRNYYPHDIEQAVCRSHSALRPNEGAAFSCEIGGRERLVVVYEVRRLKRHRPEEIVAAICRCLAEEYLLVPHAVVLIPGGTLPKTSSGKTRRRTCREMFLKKQLPVVAQWCAEDHRATSGENTRFVAPRTPLEKQLAAVWAEVLRVDRVGVHDNFFALGGNSLLATELYLRLKELLPVEFPLAQLFEQPTVAGLTEWILAARLEQEPAGPLVELLDRLERMP